VNLLHRWLCASDRWRAIVGTDLVPWVLDGVELGSSVLEVGPGPGASTDVLRRRVRTLTCVELDPRMAGALSDRTAGNNVLVLCQDATSMTFADATFDGAASLTMLHHLSSAALQDRLFREVARVLRPGGVFVGADTLVSVPLRLLHVFDTLTPVDPETLPARLEWAGFSDVRVDVRSRAFRFQARRRRSAGEGENPAAQP
jgi:SAM-dependent methyltransferase